MESLYQQIVRLAQEAGIVQGKELTEEQIKALLDQLHIATKP